MTDPMRLFDMQDQSGLAPVLAINSAMMAGRAIEFKTIWKLLEQGHKIAVPVVDDHGIDLVVNYRTTVQVKGRSTRTNRNSYSFNVGKQPTRGGAAGYPADVYIFHGVQDEAWWVVPKAALAATGRHNGSVNICLDSSGPRKRWNGLMQWRDAWSVFDD